MMFAHGRRASPEAALAEEERQRALAEANRPRSKTSRSTLKDDRDAHPAAGDLVHVRRGQLRDDQRLEVSAGESFTSPTIRGK